MKKLELMGCGSAADRHGSRRATDLDGFTQMLRSDPCESVKIRG
jgi:hypothetical protein